MYIISLCDNAALARSGKWRFRQLSRVLFTLIPYCQAMWCGFLFNGILDCVREFYVCTEHLTAANSTGSYSSSSKS